MTEQWQELKETITEMRDNDGTGTQQEVCKFLANLMDVLEKQMSDSENLNKGEWIEGDCGYYECSKCHIKRDSLINGVFNFCPNCGADMRGKT